jgi:hypothetical protein
LSRHSRSVALIATLMDSKAFYLTIAEMPGANRLTLQVLGRRTSRNLLVGPGQSEMMSRN